MKRSGFWWGATVAMAAAACFAVERFRPLRRTREPGARRVLRNLAIGMLAAVTTVAAEAPLVEPVRALAARRRLGLLRWIPFPPVVRIVLGFLLLDYTLYLWHWLNHESPALWRFHAVHHTDRDMDTTTGLRFHFGELALAAAFRAIQVVGLGVDRSTLQVWQRLLFLSVVFHHSNIELPARLERALVSVIATPGMHGIHHSTRARERHSNFSSLLSWWDHLHGTLWLRTPPATVIVGLTGFDTPKDVTLEQSLVLPFTGDPRLALALVDP